MATAKGGELGRAYRIVRIDPDPERCERQDSGRDFTLHCAQRFDDEFAWWVGGATSYRAHPLGVGPDGGPPRDGEEGDAVEAAVLSRDPVRLRIYGTPAGLRERGFAVGSWVALYGEGPSPGQA